MSFHLRRNLLVIAFIIAIISIVWLLIQALSYSVHLLTGEDDNLVGNEPTLQEVSHIEKIDNFSLQEFDANQQLSHFVKAKHYLNFKNVPILLLSPKVITYNEKGKINHILTSQRANYFDNGDVKFTGKVGIRSSGGMTHKIYTKELVVGAKTQDLISRKEVIYLGERVDIIAQGVHMKSKENKMKLTGKVNIQQESGAKILTKGLYIDESDGQKHYYSKHKTTYLDTGNKIYADGLYMDMHQNLTQLLGKVKILQKSGSKVNTKNLIVDQSKNNAIYRTKERIHYQSQIADIHAIGMYYDVKNQKIKFIGGVVGRYEQHE